MRGIVHSFDPEFDTGFIEVDGNLIFFHRSQYAGEVIRGHEVVFELGSSSLGTCAENIRNA